MLTPSHPYFDLKSNTSPVKSQWMLQLRNLVAHNAAVFIFGWATYCNLQRPIIKVLNYISGALSCTTISLHSKEASHRSHPHYRTRGKEVDVGIQQSQGAQDCQRDGLPPACTNEFPRHNENSTRARAVKRKTQQNCPGGNTSDLLLPPRAHLSAALHVCTSVPPTTDTLVNAKTWLFSFSAQAYEDEGERDQK